MGEVASSGGGLSAAELATETLFPGDTVEYFSMAFVAGDPRGHRVAKVLHVERSDEDFPIRVDTQEMLPLTMLLKRKRDRLDREIPSSDAKWRKLRTFRLVDGEVEGETRAQRLNAGLKKAVGDAFAAVRKQLAADNAQAKSRQLMQNFFKPAAPKENENDHNSGSDDDDDDFEHSPSSKKKAHTEDCRSTPRPVKRAPLATAGETELNRRHPRSEARSAEREMGTKKKRKPKQQRKDREHNDHSHHRMASPSPRRAYAREREGDRVMKRKRLDFTNGLSNERLLGETTAADDNNDHDDSGDALLSASRRSSPHRSQRHVTPEMVKKKKHKIQIQKYVDQIQEKKSSASLDEYMKLDKKEQALKKIIERKGWASSSTPSSASRPTKTLQLNKNAVDAHRWQDSRKKFRDSQANSNTGISSWLKKRPSTNESTHASPSPSKKRHDKGVKKTTPEGTRERRAVLTALEIMQSEVFDKPGPKQANPGGERQEKQGKSVTKVESVKSRRPSGGLYSNVGRKSSSDGKRAKAASVKSASSSLMNTWVQRKK